MTPNPPSLPIVNLARLTARVCRESFSLFVREFWEEVPGTGELIWNWHMDFLCEEMQAVAERIFLGRRKLYDVVVNISPGTSKSTLCSILFPAWMWTRMPHARILTSSHTDELVLDLANKSRTVIKSDKYRVCFPDIVIRADQDTKGYYANTLGGDRKTCTVGGKSPIGFHAHAVINDDPLDPKKAISEVELRAARFFYDSVIPSRKVNKAVSVEFTIMQRLHTDDPTGHLLARARRENTIPIRHICLPASLPLGDNGEYLSGNVSPPELVERYIDGLMDPVRLPRHQLQIERATMGPYSYAGQYDQSPTPLTGGMFKISYFSQVVKAAPYNAQRIRYWDRASSDTPGGCRTAGVLMARDVEGNYYVEHVVWGQWEPTERNKVIQSTAIKDRARYGPKHAPTIYIEAEGGSSGRDAWKDIARLLAGFPVREDRPTGRKEARAEPWSCQLAAKTVYLVDDGTWDLASYVNEHILFPMATLKDQVDASCLVAGTMVTTIRGEVPIESVVVGDLVMTRDGWKEVEWSGQSGIASHLLSVTFSDGRYLVGTREHLVLTQERGWIMLASLLPDDKVFTNRGGQDPENLSSLSITSITSQIILPVPVYDLKVRDSHEFYANGVLVHNSGAFNILAGRKQGFGLRTFRLGAQRKGSFRIVVCDEASLAGLIIEGNHHCLLVRFRSPDVIEGDSPSLPSHVIPSLLGFHDVPCLDARASDFQDNWNDPVEPYDKPPVSLLLSREQGKAFWSFLLRKRDPSADVWIFVDEGDRAMSAAIACCNVLSLPKERTLFDCTRPDTVIESSRVPPNQYIHDVLKEARSLVI